LAGALSALAGASTFADAAGAAAGAAFACAAVGAGVWALTITGAPKEITAPVANANKIFEVLISFIFNFPL
jgi:hypothetical protein